MSRVFVKTAAWFINICRHSIQYPFHRFSLSVAIIFSASPVSTDVMYSDNVL